MEYALVLVIFTLTAPILAEIPTFISYQGLVTDSLGNPLVGEHSVVLNIYDTDSSPSPLWSSGTLSGTLTDGLFSVPLGPIPADVFTSGSQRYLGITIDSDEELTPRVEIEAVPYAFLAQIADTARYALAAPASPDDDWTISGSDIYHESGNVGIGTDSPNALLVVGDDLGPTTGKHIVIGDNDVGAFPGIIVGRSDQYQGWLSYNVDNDYMNLGTREGPNIYANTFVAKAGRLGFGTMPEDSAVAALEHTYDDPNTVYGLLMNTTNVDAGLTSIMYGIYSMAQGAGNTRCGIYGYGTSSTGSQVEGASYGVRGLARLTTGNFGVSGSASSGNVNYGVYGSATDATVNKYGVYGTCNSSNQDYGMYCVGNFHATGTTTKAAGGYRIDHPQDPENSYLMHRDVSSPEMKNVYDGVVTLDADGRAVVDLPDYFESLNESFRYQLTPIGAAMPDLHISARIAGNHFAIAGGKPYMEVCWQVTGIRKDAFAKSQNARVKIAKAVDERGLYQNPELFDAGFEKSVDYRYHDHNSAVSRATE
jgi:hypothetical protein